MPPNPSSAKVTAPTLRVKPEHFAAAKPTPPTSIVQDPPAPKPKAGGGDASSPGVPAAGAGTPPKAGGGKPGVAALIILFILFILSSPGQATSTSFIVTNDLGGLQNFTLYSVSAGVYTLSGVTGVATNSHATLTGTGTNWAGVLALNTNNNLAAITSFNAMGTNPAQNKASVLLSLAIHQIINLGGASAPSLNTNSGGGGTNTSPGFAPAPVSMWTGTNNPNGLITSGLGSLYEQYDVTGTNFLRQWVKTTPIGTAGWALAGSNPSGNGAALTNLQVSALAPGSGVLGEGSLTYGPTNATGGEYVITVINGQRYRVAFTNAAVAAGVAFTNANIAPTNNSLAPFNLTGLLPGEGVCSFGTFEPVKGAYGGAGQNQENVWVGFKSPPYPISNLRAWFSAYNGVGSSNNALVIHSAWEYPFQTIYENRYQGNTNAFVPGGSAIATDPNPNVVVPANTVFWLRMFITAPNSGQIPTGLYEDNNGFPGGFSGYGTNLTDYTLGGAYWTNSGSAQYGPIAITGTRADGSKSRPAQVVLIGDSRDWAPNGFGGLGLQVPLESVVISNNVGYANLAESGSAFYDDLNDVTRTNLVPRLGNILICGYGINSFITGQNFATTTNQAVQTWQRYANLGMKVYQETILPDTTSSDNWMTTTGQTYVAGVSSNVIAFNNWIRTTPAPLSGYIEKAYLYESSPNSGLWAVNGTTNWATVDGVHPAAGIMQTLTTNAGLLANYQAIWNGTLSTPGTTLGFNAVTNYGIDFWITPPVSAGFYGNMNSWANAFGMQGLGTVNWINATTNYSNGQVNDFAPLPAQMFWPGRTNLITTWHLMTTNSYATTWGVGLAVTYMTNGQPQQTSIFTGPYHASLPQQAGTNLQTLVYTNTIPSYINTNVISAAFCLLVYSNAGGCLLLDNMAVAH